MLEFWFDYLSIWSNGLPDVKRRQGACESEEQFSKSELLSGTRPLNTISVDEHLSQPTTLTFFQNRTRYPRVQTQLY